MVGLDSFEFPVIALKHKVKVDLSVRNQLYLEVLRKTMLALNHNLHPYHLRFFQHLQRLRLFLDANDESMLTVVDDLTSLSNDWVLQLSQVLKVHHVQDRLL